LDKGKLIIVTIARKPIENTVSVATNVMAYGCGGVNIDASRIAGSISALERWPANVVLNRNLAILFPETTSGFGIKNLLSRNKYIGVALNQSSTKGSGRFFSGDSGSAARFFYQVREQE
jgi:hypothetical protein